jgi:hypothetical protein
MPATPIAAQLAAAILGTSLMAADQAHTSELDAEAAVMNQAMAELEARKMRQTIGSLDSKYASAEREAGRAIKIAAAMTVAQGDLEKLAWLLEAQGMDKEAVNAFLGGLARAGGAALKGIGGAVSAAGRLSIPHTPASPQLLQRAGSWVGRQAHAAEGAGARLMAAAPKAAPVAAAAPLAAAASKPLISTGTKAKLLAGGALAGVGYMGLKGMQSARDFMMAPTGHSEAPIMNNVNELGYPQY